MRVVTSFYSILGAIHTVVPSEPILSMAAMQLLFRRTQNWNESISTMCKVLFGGALVDKGFKGELYARLLLTLSKCFSIPNWRPRSPITPIES